MKKSILLFITVASFFYAISCSADEVITFFFKEYPSDTNKAYLQTTCAQLKDPATHNSFCFNSVLEHAPITGIFSTYAGYMNLSDLNGQVVFPRRHTAPKVSILITPSITPVLITENTIHHWELEPNVPAQLFSVQKMIDKATGDSYWDIEDQPLPEDNVVPLDSILIFAKPENLYVQTGILPVMTEQNLLLPAIYVKPSMNTTKNALYVLNMRQFFGRSKYMTRIMDKSYAKQFSH